MHRFDYRCGVLRSEENLTPVSWESQNANFKQEQAEKQAKLQSFLKGEVPYTSFSEMLDLANSEDDPNTVLISMAEVAIAQGKKEQLAKDISEYLKENNSLDELQQLASDNALDVLPNSNKDMFLFLKNTLGLDFGAIYKEALASQPETTPKEELPLDAFLPDADFDWGNWGNSSDFFNFDTAIRRNVRVGRQLDGRSNTYYNKGKNR